MKIFKFIFLIFTMVLISQANVMAAEIWVTGASHRVIRTEKAPASSEIFDAKSKTITLFGARNEFVDFQIVFSGPMTSVNVESFTLKGPGKTTLKHIQRFREHYMNHEIISQYAAKSKVPDCVDYDEKRKALGAPREFPVQLVPLHAKKYGADTVPNLFLNSFFPLGTRPLPWVASLNFPLP